MNALAFAIGAVEGRQRSTASIFSKPQKSDASNSSSNCGRYLLIDALQLKLNPLPQKAIIKEIRISYSSRSISARENVS